MAADSNMNFHQGLIPSSFYNSHLVSFQSGTVSSSTGMVPGGMNSSGAISSSTGMLLSGNPTMMGNGSSVILPRTASGNNILFDPLPGLKHDTGLAVDWSLEEQAILREGLDKYANEPNIMKYIKIAAMLREKTVRDVALRCRWMTKKENGKRRKPEECFMGKKIKDRKEKMVDSFPKMNISSIPSGNMLGYAHLMQRMTHNRFMHEGPAIDSATKNLLDENSRVLSQISSNLETFKLQDNINLFYRMRNNVATILTSMSKMPGIMSQMPPLPVSINEDLVNVIIPGANQAYFFRTRGASS
ncbi:Homeodomain-like protein [Dioscorea alata]|uniref:Homeodomain-like protein n=2 Tax=Dioscorea alata TaxID=55571 RepID=A0ACB7UUA8_DIOAL|nr:Homeodomain-like protein [Dioscorea alata]KAH7664343.1 Homeodomain-like protein [Dioscorea alata]